MGEIISKELEKKLIKSSQSLIQEFSHFSLLLENGPESTELIELAKTGQRFDVGGLYGVLVEKYLDNADFRSIFSGEEGQQYSDCRLFYFRASFCDPEKMQFKKFVFDEENSNHIILQFKPTDQETAYQKERV